MASIEFSKLLKIVDPCDLEEPAVKKQLPSGSYRAQVISAKPGYTINGRKKYTVCMVVSEGEWEGMMIRWTLAIVPEHPRLLHEFFANMAKVGVGRDFFATVTEDYDVVRQIVLTAAYLDVTVERGNYLNVLHARRVIVP